MIKKIISINGMTCVNCENKIERSLSKKAGIEKIEASYSKGNAIIWYQEEIISFNEIIKEIEKAGYQVNQDKVIQKSKDEPTKIVGILIILLALFFLMQRFGIVNNIINAFPLAKEGMGYGMLFIIGLLTSVHCVAMCGGINISQCMPKNGVENTQQGRFASLKPSFYYNLGRVISYTVIGGIVGALGSVFSFSGSTKGIIQIIAGIFMVIMGLNLLNVFPWLRKLNPRMPKKFAGLIHASKADKGPLTIGLLNGLMPCGPLQAMQLYALATGDPLQGALSMALFSLGTVPLMFGLGALSTILSKKFTSKIMTVGAILVIVLGFAMFNNGMGLSGVMVGSGSSTSVAAENRAQIIDGVQVVTTSLSSGRYEPIEVQVGVPVKWTIAAEEGTLNGCNNSIYIPEYDIEKDLQVGDNIIEFTPTETGKFSYSCWMGMIRSSITVLDEEGNSNTSGTTDETTGGQKSGVQIPTDEVAIGTVDGETQKVEIGLNDTRFSPAIIILQEGLETEWIINSKATNENSSTLLFPIYNTQLPMVEGENPLYFYPTIDFEFSSGDNSFYGVVKVVKDINNIDIEAIKEEVKNLETTIWNFDESSLQDNSGSGASCH